VCNCKPLQLANAVGIYPLCFFGSITKVVKTVLILKRAFNSPYTNEVQLRKPLLLELHLNDHKVQDYCSAPVISSLWHFTCILISIGCKIYSCQSWYSSEVPHSCIL